MIAEHSAKKYVKRQPFCKSYDDFKTATRTNQLLLQINFLSLFIQIISIFSLPLMKAVAFFTFQNISDHMIGRHRSWNNLARGDRFTGFGAINVKDRHYKSLVKQGQRTPFFTTNLTADPLGGNKCFNLTKPVFSRITPCHSPLPFPLFSSLIVSSICVSSFASG